MIVRLFTEAMKAVPAFAQATTSSTDPNPESTIKTPLYLLLKEEDGEAEEGPAPFAEVLY